MNEHSEMRSIRCKPRPQRAFILAVLFALAGAACDAEKKAVPDPQKPPLPKTAQHR